MSDTSSSSSSCVTSRWKNLLTSRWCISSRIVAFVSLVLLLVANLPGQGERRPLLTLPSNYRSPIYMKVQYEHGWPWKYALRDEPGVSPPAYQRATLGQCWRFWAIGNHDAFFPAILVADLMVVVVIALGIGCYFEKRVRKIGSVWRYRLIDLGLGILVISILLAWYTSARREHLREQEAVAKLSGHSVMADLVEVQRGGPTTLRFFGADSLWEDFDRVIGAHAYDIDAQAAPHWQSLRNLRGLSSYGNAPEDVPVLNGFTKLDALHISIANHTGGYVVPENGPFERAEIPPLTQLRGLFLGPSGTVPVGLGRLVNLEVLDLGGVPVLEETMSELEELKKLRELSLAKSSISVSAVDDNSLAHLSRLAHLEELRLGGCQIKGNGLKHLRSLPRLTRLDLSDTPINDDAVKELLKFNSLESLDVRGTSLPKSAVAKLQSAFPKCTIVGPEPAPATPQSGSVY